MNSPSLELRTTTYEVADGVATVTLARPLRNNAWTGRMHTEYRHLLQTAEDDPGVRVIVLTGEGRAFCVGGDAQALDGHAERGGYDAGTPPELDHPGYGLDPAFDADFAFQLAMETPIIAKVNGAAAGVGLAAVLFADLRFAAAGIRMTTAHGKLALAAEFGMSWLLPLLIGRTRATDLLLSSRKFTSDEVADWGLFNQVVPAGELDGVVDSYARMLATEVAPASLRATKRQLALDLTRSLAASVDDAAVRLDSMMSSQDYREGVTALMEKRPPRFEDR